MTDNALHLPGRAPTLGGQGSSLKDFLLGEAARGSVPSPTGPSFLGGIPSSAAEVDELGTGQRVAIGLTGVGRRFLKGRDARELASAQKAEKLDRSRLQALAKDSRAITRFLQQGKVQSALDLLNNRERDIVALGGDPVHTRTRRELVENGQVDEAIRQGLVTDTQAVSKGFIDPPAERFETFQTESGQQLQRSRTTGREIASPRQATARTARTNIGKARLDLDDGLITQDDFNTIAVTPPKFQTATGKLIADKQAAISLFGADSEQVRLMDEAIQSASQGEKRNLTDEAGMRKEFTKLSGDFIKVRDSVAKVRVSSPNAAGDLALIFNFMKILDPGSVVREGEQALARNAAGVPDRIRTTYNNLLAGESLAPEQRLRFKEEAEKVFKSTQQGQDKLERQFSGLATRAGFDPLNIVIDFSTVKPIGAGPVQPAAPAQAGLAAPTVPTVLRFDAQGNPI